MLGISVHGLLGVDADLQRSAYAAKTQQNTVGYHSVRVEHPYGDCDGATPPPPRSRTRT